MAVTQTTTFQLPIQSSDHEYITVGITISVVLLLLVISLVLLYKYKPRLFPCFNYRYQRTRQTSQVGLSFEEEKEYQNDTVVPEIATSDEGYFYDEIFGKSAFTDETTNHSITNLFTITDYDETSEPFSSGKF